ncbi:hypothetical protein BBJ28_00007225 [Nothophytophthora sp. Chile5]|nr:hypothetical protein BBJ28_00007225 [Nothophytophthora sp. Chile5]
MSFAQWLGIRWEGLVPAVIIPLFTTALLFTGSLLANALRLLNVSKQFHSNGLWFAIKNSALYYSITRDRLPSLRTYVLVRGSFLTPYAIETMVFDVQSRVW